MSQHHPSNKFRYYALMPPQDPTIQQPPGTDGTQYRAIFLPSFPSGQMVDSSQDSGQEEPVFLREPVFLASPSSGQGPSAAPVIEGPTPYAVAASSATVHAAIGMREYVVLVQSMREVLSAEQAEYASIIASLSNIQSSLQDVRASVGAQLARLETTCQSLATALQTTAIRNQSFL
ncbi:hypothetical protein NM688_g7805 [Phlebia brevispora]|uniref:Uncharacterized protein n=1 Tax=Phlebia brevispora TaxID=194682 RepID=A0ACC1S192_9APHY|nr:hypothetical protein NM688_g7805 [Phlebia brevispora]